MKLQYRETGDVTNPVIIILHGLFGSGDNWLTTSKAFADRYRVFLPDARNHGRSPHSETFSYDEMANDILELLDDNLIGQCYLIGHSMGGKTTMNFAQRFPERLKAAMVVDISPRYYPPHHQSVLAGFHAIDLATLQNRQQADEILSLHVKGVGERQFMLKNLYRQEDGSFAWRMNLDILTREIEQIGEGLTATQIDVRTIFVRGEKSNYITDEDAKEIKRIFPNSELHTIAGAGHWVQADKPVEFAELVNRTLLK